MDHRVDAVAGPQLPLDVVDNVVNLQQVLVGGTSAWKDIMARPGP